MPTRFLHDCRRTAARNLIRANVPERVAMLLTGHKSRAIFDRYNIIHEQETARRRGPTRRLSGTAGTGDAPRARAPDRRRRHAHRASPPPRATHHRLRAHGPPATARGRGPGGGGGSPDTARLCAGDCILAPEYGPARDRGTRGDGAGRRGRPRART